ncbi:tetratricopeptide repeat protein [Larsenimonas rhizosphaerae]|uniref:tetratricopeptide repeat protein n=1 Tax=Larsenimonas rhizosphaerae TaxID=2944682 RepID=UPI0020349B33|nr:hypothetical protein [Larsenimonas rhizosphaerae]MCM2130943.1 hypothetical protein [Larsenimonas rhizosphaerae]
MKVLRVALLLVAGLVCVGPVLADGPALPEATVTRIQSLEGTLDRHPARVIEQARRALGELSSSRQDQWVQALYWQLMARAFAAQGKAEEAAEYFNRARNNDVAPIALRRNWLREAARWTLAAGDTARGRALFERWAGQSTPSAQDLWTLVELAVQARDWSGASHWLSRAMQAGIAMTSERSALAQAIYQHSSDAGNAQRLVQRDIDRAPDDPMVWKRGVALYQQMNQPGRAAALWEAGWRRGVLSGADALETRIRLHLAGGTPARAAEYLQQALKEGILPSDEAHLRQLADAWTAARARHQALTAWQSLSEHTRAPADWSQMGELAYQWGQWDLVVTAMTRARAAGLEHAGRSWLLQAVAESTAGRQQQALAALDKAVSAGDGEIRQQALAWRKALTPSKSGAGSA